MASRSRRLDNFLLAFCMARILAQSAPGNTTYQQKLGFRSRKPPNRRIMSAFSALCEPPWGPEWAHESPKFDTCTAADARGRRRAICPALRRALPMAQGQDPSPGLAAARRPIRHNGAPFARQAPISGQREVQGLPVDGRAPRRNSSDGLSPTRASAALLDGAPGTNHLRCVADHAGPGELAWGPKRRLK